MEGLFSAFDGIYVINLPERADRRRAILAELKPFGVTESTPGFTIFPAIRPADAGGFPSIGCRGCFLSHLAVLKDALGKGVKRLLVLEDDLELTPQFRKFSVQALAELRAHHWDFAYPGHRLPLQPASVLFQPYSQDIVTAHCFAVNGDQLEDLISFLEAILKRPPGHPDGGPMHVDGAYSTYRMQNPDLRTLVAVPSLATQRSSSSDVTPSGWWDTVGPIRVVLNTIRRWIAPLRR